MVGGLEIVQLVNEFKSYEESSEDEHKTPREGLPHHEDPNSFETTLSGYFNAQSNIVRDISMTKNVMADPPIKSVLNAKKMGEAQYQAYVTERLLTCKKSIYEVIPKANCISQQECSEILKR